MSNSDEDAKQKQWEMRNSDRRDTFEGVKYGLRTGDVRTIDPREYPLRVLWSADSQEGTDGPLSGDPVAVRQVHVWPSDVVPPEDGTMVLAESLFDAENGRVHTVSSGNGHESADWERWVDVYVPAADGD